MVFGSERHNSDHSVNVASVNVPMVFESTSTPQITHYYYCHHRTDGVSRQISEHSINIAAVTEPTLFGPQSRYCCHIFLIAFPRSGCLKTAAMGGVIISVCVACAWRWGGLRSSKAHISPTQPLLVSSRNAPPH